MQQKNVFSQTYLSIYIKMHTFSCKRASSRHLPNLAVWSSFRVPAANMQSGPITTYFLFSVFCNPGLRPPLRRYSSSHDVSSEIPQTWWPDDSGSFQYIALVPAVSGCPCMRGRACREGSCRERCRRRWKKGCWIFYWDGVWLRSVQATLLLSLGKTMRLHDAYSPSTDSSRCRMPPGNSTGSNTTSSTYKGQSS